MKDRFKIKWWFFVCLVIASCHADHQKQEKQYMETPEVGLINANEEVKNIVDAFNEALVNPRRGVLDDLCDNNLTYGHSSGLIQNKKEFIADLLNGPFDFTTVDVTDQKIYISDRTAVVRHIFSAQALNQGEPVNVRIGNMMVFIMSEKHQWQLLARQAYKL